MTRRVVVVAPALKSDNWVVWRAKVDDPTAWDHLPVHEVREDGTEVRLTTEAKFVECRYCVEGLCIQTVETKRGSLPYHGHHRPADLRLL